MGGGWLESRGVDQIMDEPAYGVLKGKLEKITKSNVNTAWLANKLLEANIIDESDVEEVNALEGASARRAELTEMLLGSGAPGVFQVFFNILFSKPKLRWLANELKGKQFVIFFSVVLCSYNNYYYWYTSFLTTGAFYPPKDVHVR